MRRWRQVRQVPGTRRPWYLVIFFQMGCAALFGWDVHAPGILSGNFAYQVSPVHSRVALYLPEEVVKYESTNRGSWSADPQKYHVGEAFAPMLVEAFQAAFDEFILVEAEPTPEILQQYGIAYLAVVRIKDFHNQVTWKGQALGLETETVIFNLQMQTLVRFESHGSSDAEKVFAKKGGPQVHLNAALENTTIAIVQYLQDFVRSHA